MVMEVCRILFGATLFVPVVSKKWAFECERNGIDLRTSFMQSLPFKEKLNKVYAVLMFHVLALESFDLSEFDLVVSISSRYAHGIITKPGSKHVCYMNTPGRMFWEPYKYFLSESLVWKIILVMLAPFLVHTRVWDYFSAQHVDKFVTNSKTTQDRISKYYRRKSEIVYPFASIPVESSMEIVDSAVVPGKYFLIVSRLNQWKRIDIAVKACKESGLDLYVIGEGPARPELEKTAGNSTHIRFLGFVSDDEKIRYIKNCQALIHPQEEDFGITAVEAQSLGKPVIAYGKGGALETIICGKSGDKTGEFFYEQTSEALGAILKSFNPGDYNSELGKKHSGEFSRDKFEANFLSALEEVYN